MRQYTAAVWAFSLLLALLLATCRNRESLRDQQARTSSASVLLITLDTLRPDLLGWIGGRNETPAIDRLAEEGFRFPAAISPVPLTLPSHAAMMTGVLPRRLGLRDNGQMLGAEPVTLAEILRTRGYATAAFVSGYPLARAFGLDRGFDSYDDQFTMGEGESLERPAPDTAAAAVKWLASAREPWFLWVHFYDPHYPYEPPAEFARPGTKGPYDGEVAFADRAIGELLAAAESAANQAFLTVFAGDHGESLGEHGEGTHGFFVYDATVLVPLVFRLPGTIHPGESREPARLLDLAPTILDLLSAPSLPRADGASLVATLRGNPQEISPTYVETYQPWLSYGWSPLQAVRSAGWKFIAAPRPELYDLASDPGENQNVFDTNREQARALARLHRDILKLPALSTPKESPDPEAMAKLRALGYVGSGGFSAEPPAAGLRDPKDARELRDLLTAADLLLRAGEYRRAIPKFEEVLSRDPRNRFALLRSGVALLSAGAVARAIPRLETAVQLSPDQAEARSALAQALMRAGRAEEAVPHAMEATRLQPRRAATWADLGNALGLSKKPQQAVRAFERAVELEPHNSRLLARLAFAEHAAGRIREAAEHLERTAGLEGDQFPYSGALGIILADLGRADDAREWLARSREGEGDFAESRFRLALLEADRGDLKSARQALHEAVAVSPELRVRARRSPKLVDLLPER